uniref:Putative secreted protein ovary overexpressed n=1 Tax=Rhipicephalus microplus TaxID=6941 RepID=A0A6M2DDE4_RHIMP
MFCFFFFFFWTTSHYIATQTCLHCCLIDIAPAYSHFCDLVKLAFLQENYFSLYSIHNTSFYEMQFFVCIILLRVNCTDKMQHSLLKYLCHTYF